MICNKSGKFYYCSSCFHFKKHIEIINNKISCKIWGSCFDGKKYHKVKCIGDVIKTK